MITVTAKIETATTAPVEIPPRTTSINPAQIELPDINTDTGDGDAGLAELATGDE
jgi:hypothetical protein